MRLNHVESFYAFLLHFHSKRSEEEDGRPATAGPPAGAASHDLATCKGAASHDLATCKGAASCGQGPLQMGDWLRPRPFTNGRPGHLQGGGQQAPTGMAACSAAPAGVADYRVAPVGVAGCRVAHARGYLPATRP
ncbi:hypothetical protein GW17_00051145 [Ensete ventricosum]|nr:hypothetical protein GW17_00051145 [Ensete ventricosum]